MHLINETSTFTCSRIASDVVLYRIFLLMFLWEVITGVPLAIRLLKRRIYMCQGEVEVLSQCEFCVLGREDTVYIMQSLNLSEVHNDYCNLCRVGHAGS